jgi:hypothetical protein
VTGGDAELLGELVDGEEAGDGLGGGHGWVSGVVVGCLRGPSRLPAARRDGPLRVTTGRSILLTGDVLTCHTHLHPRSHLIFFLTTNVPYWPSFTDPNFASDLDSLLLI